MKFQIIIETKILNNIVLALNLTDFVFILQIDFKKLKSVEHENRFEPLHEISNNVVCATSKASDQPAHTRSLIRAFASRLSIL